MARHWCKLYHPNMLFLCVLYHNLLWNFCVYIVYRDVHIIGLAIEHRTTKYIYNYATYEAGMYNGEAQKWYLTPYFHVHNLFIYITSSVTYNMKDKYLPC